MNKNMRVAVKIQQTSDYVTLDKFTENEAIGMEYQRTLMDVTRKMVNELKLSVQDIYRDNRSQIVYDASPASQINDAIAKIVSKYTKIFNDNAKRWASIFVKQVDSFGQQELDKNALKAGITVKMDARTRAMLNKQQAVILENVQLIKSIPEEMQKNIQGDVMRSMSEGRNLTYLEQKLTERGIKTRNRIRLIARDQLSKATSTLNTQRTIDAGFTQAVWKHSHAGRKPRVSHVNANNKIYDMNKGCLIDGEYIQPGQLVNCRCNFAICIKVKN